MTQSIIVYRNPLEQMFWESAMNSEYIFPVFVAAIVYISSVMMIESYAIPLVSKLYTKVTGKYKRNFGYTSLILAAVPAVVVFKYMVI